MKFSTVALGVADLTVAERFCVEGLGFAVDSRPQPDLVYLASGETRIALYSSDALAEYAGIAARPAGGIVLSLNLDSAAQVDQVCARCIECGGTVLRAPGPMAWGGYAGTVQDPDGHLWEIVHAG